MSQAQHNGIHGRDGSIHGRAEEFYWRLREGLRTGQISEREASTMQRRMASIMDQSRGSMADNAKTYELWVHLPFQAAHVYKQVSFDDIRTILGHTLYYLSYEPNERASNPMSEWADYCMIEVVEDNGHVSKASIQQEYGAWHVVGLIDPETGREEVIPMLAPSEKPHPMIADDTTQERMSVVMHPSEERRRAEVRVKYKRMVTMLQGAVKAMPDILDDEFLAAIAPIMQDVAALLELPYEPIERVRTTASVKPSQDSEQEKREPVSPGYDAMRQTQNMHLIDVEAMVRARVRQEFMNEAQRKTNEASMRLDEIAQPPKDWASSKKQWLEQNARQIAELRKERDTNNDIYQSIRVNAPGEELRARMQKRYDEIMQDPAEIEASKAPRLKSLLERAFEEESKDEQFYPTPDDVIERFIIEPLRSHYDVNAAIKVLEPSAGRGNIADAIRAAFPNAQIDVCEINALRREILALKNYHVVGTDFLLFAADRSNDGRYDVVAMNPPFNRGVGMAHVMKAANLVRQNGYLYAVLPESNVFGENKEAVYFQDKMAKYGSIARNAIVAKEYNKNHDRKITINIGILELHKNKEAGYGDQSGPSAREAIATYATKIDLQRPDLERDAEFVEPEIITARKDITKPATIDVIDQRFRDMPFIKDYVFEGVNKAIESIDAVGGFLLADGTGTGKTIQSLMTAYHYWKTTGKPVLIFTVDDRVMQTSFFDDAQKLGFETPDRINIETARKPARPQNYRGLYDDDNGTGDDRVPKVYRHRFGNPLTDGIGVCTYHDLSQFKGLESYNAEIKIAREAVAVARREHSEARRDLERALNLRFPKDAKGRRKDKGYAEAKEAGMKQLEEQYFTEHPAYRQLYLATEAKKIAAQNAIAGFAGDTQLIIFDEAHKIKNAGDGIEQDKLPLRALLGMVLVNRCPRIMYVTATPADRAFDILYLKKTRLWRDDEEYRRTMDYIGYKWHEAVTNKAGEIVIGPRWSKNNSMDEFDLRKSNETMRRLFERITEDGQMLRREIQLTNLTVRMNKFQAPPAALVEMDSIKEAYTTEDESGRERVDWMQVYRAQMEALELYKIPKAIELVDNAVMRGRQVIVFGYTTEEGDEEREATGTTKIGTVEILKKALAERYGEENVGVIMGTKGPYEEYRRLENVREFQEGRRPVLIGTITSGGTGLNLDDTTGTRPRTLIIITPPMSFINVMQGLGRIVRANTQSRSEAEFIFTDNTAVDEWMSRILASKFSTLAATVEGETSRLNPDQMDATENTGAQGSASIIAGATESEPEIMTHPLFKKKNFHVDGWTLADNVPLWIDISGTPGNTLIALGGKTREDLEEWRIKNAELIERHGLTINPDQNLRRYRGTYYGIEWKRGRDRDSYKQIVEELLNTVDPKILVRDERQIDFTEGQEIRVREALQWAGIATGTVGRIVKIRPARIAGQPPFYDIEINGRIVNCVNQISLQNVGIAQAADVVKYHVGQTWVYGGYDATSKFFHVYEARITSINGYEVELTYKAKGDKYEYASGGYKYTEDEATITMDVLEVDQYLDNKILVPASEQEATYPKVADL